MMRRFAAFIRAARVAPPLAAEHEMEWAEVEALVNRARWRRVWWRRR